MPSSGLRDNRLIGRRQGACDFDTIRIVRLERESSAKIKILEKNYLNFGAKK